MKTLNVLLICLTVTFLALCFRPKPEPVKAALPVIVQPQVDSRLMIEMAKDELRAEREAEMAVWQREYAIANAAANQYRYQQEDVLRGAQQRSRLARHRADQAERKYYMNLAERQSLVLPQEVEISHTFPYGLPAHAVFR